MQHPGMLLSLGLFVVQALVVGQTVAADPTPLLVPGATKHPLVVLEQHRASVVQRIVSEWAADLPALSESRRMTKAQLSNALWALRSDRLLAASLAGSFATIEALLADAKQDSAALQRVNAKALGDANADLAYTPINPCRIADTRNAGGPLAANVARLFDGFSANFSTQGGTASNCGMPNGAAAIAMNVYAVNPTSLGFIKVWPANGAEPAVSTVNYQTGIVAIATGAIVPVDGANSNRFMAKSPAAVDFIVDVVGYFSAPAWLIAGDGNTSVGSGAGGVFGTANGAHNSAFGSQALASLVQGNDNTAMGRSALFNDTDGSENTAVGMAAMFTNTTGAANTAMGFTTLFSNTTGTDNTALGRSSLSGNNTGSGNTAVGRDALSTNTIGLGNTAVGAYSMPGSTGILNTATGYDAMHAMAAGNYNVAVGWEALLQSSSGSWNTVVGSQALRNTFGSTNNVSIGAESLENFVVGTNNVAIGFQAAINLTSGDNNIHIGNEALTTENGTIRIGSSPKHSKLFLAGVYNTVIPGGSAMLIGGTGQVGTIPSSVRYKEQIEGLGDTSDALLKLRPVKFHYKGYADAPYQFGLIAEEVAGVLPELVGYSASGEPETVYYHEMPALLLNELQKEHRKIEDQQREIAELRRMILDLRSTIEVKAVMR